jgi:hypothetical protein
MVCASETQQSAYTIALVLLLTMGQFWPAMSTYWSINTGGWLDRSGWGKPERTFI